MKTSILLSAVAVCLAEADPYYRIHTAIPSIDPNRNGKPPHGLSDEEFKSWQKSYSLYSMSTAAAWASYASAHASELSKAQIAVEHFAVTATQYHVPPDATRTEPYHNTIYTTLPEWFTALSEEIQSIKLAEGEALDSIAEGGNSKGLAPKETGRAALGMLAGVAVVAAVM